MLPEIVKQIALQIYGLGLFSKVGALASEYSATLGDSQALYVAAQVAPFASQTAETLSPSAAERGICFFQASATRVLRQDVFLRQCENDLTFTFWANGGRLSGTQDGTLETQIINAVRSVRVAIPEGSPIRTLEIQHTGDLFGESANRWGWEGKMLQFNLPPHKIGQIRFRVTYTVGTGCYSQTVEVVNPAC